MTSSDEYKRQGSSVPRSGFACMTFRVRDFVLLTTLIAVLPGPGPAADPPRGRAMVRTPKPAEPKTGINRLQSSSGAGLDIGSVIGANPFYTNGFTGAGVTIANIEGGYAAGNLTGLTGTYAGGHETLSHVTTFFKSTTNTTANTSLLDRHATWVSHALAGADNPGGNPLQRRGIAYGATLWSGAIGTSWNGPAYSTSFNISYTSFVHPYRMAILGDNPGVISTTQTLTGTARVINSSWSDDIDTTGAGDGNFSRAIDALVFQKGTTFDSPAVVFSAGNNGLGNGTVGGSTIGGPPAGYNVISVGALNNDTTNPPYNAVASFSSRGPLPVFVPLISNPTDINNATHGTVINSARGRVDILAPGAQLTLAYYGGATGGNTGGSANGSVSQYSSNIEGTSFAAPIVAGGLTLMAQAGAALPATNSPLDGRVLKAVLLNSADKIPGWSNNATGSGTTASPSVTTQGLDYNMGAGRMNLTRAYDQYLTGTTGVTSLTGGTVTARGWALGQVNSTNRNGDYSISDELRGGSAFTVTTSFYVNRSISASNTTLEQRFDNLDLQVYRLDTQGGAIQAGNLVARSSSVYDTTEHIFFSLPADGFYAIRITWIGTNWNFTATDGAAYGLAWNATPVPEPAFLLIVAGPVAIAVIRRRRSAAG